jgi:RNA polymerase-binding transcription factor DksA
MTEWTRTQSKIDFAQSLHSGHRTVTLVLDGVRMEIDALHSALLSLTVIPEQIRIAREKVSAVTVSDTFAFEEFLRGTERDLRLAKAALARELGFGVCHCCWPPELLVMDNEGRTRCPAAALPRAVAGDKSKKKPRRDSFTRAQKEKLVRLRDALVDSITGVAKDNLRSRANGMEAASFVGDQADTGSDASEHDFALSLLVQEHDALSEIDHALKRIDHGTYGVCEMSGQPIPRARLAAIPFARYTVECQSQIEQRRKNSKARRPSQSLWKVIPDGGESPRASWRDQGSLAERTIAFNSAEVSLYPRFETVSAD